MTSGAHHVEAEDSVFAPQRPAAGVDDLLEAAGDAIAEKARTPAQIEALLLLPREEVYERLRQRAQEALIALQGERKRRSTNHPTVKRLEQAAMEGRQRLVDEGHLVTKEDLSHRLGLKPPALNKAVGDKRMFTLDVGPKRYFPAFYAHSAIDRAHLERVTRSLGDLGGGAKWQFFVRPHAYFEGKTPLEMLERGKLELVERAALAYAER